MRDIVKAQERLGGRDQQLVMDRFRQNLANNPEVLPRVLEQYRNGVSWNSPGNPVREAITWIPDNLQIAGFGGGTSGFDRLLQGQDSRRETYSAFGDIAHDLNNRIGGCMPEGVLASFAGSICDTGEWPFAPRYGLAYGDADDLASYVEEEVAP
ncbi:MAG: hypothetical protein GF355_05505 [Candidatus Eisenbacteria bacterium]|nr:hypothetical protein [Candidatus Eisenbacteria bacterium]